MGDGQGMNDVTKELEDESQLEGLQGEKDEKRDCEQPKDGEEDTAMDVSFDFEADLQNEKDKEENDPDKQKEKEQKEEELDREIGDVDLNDGG